jgi:glucokinase
MKVLAGDVGATKTRLALVEPGEGFLRVAAEAEQPSGDHAGLADLVRTFLDSAVEAPAAAAFGLPGPVLGRQARLTNLPWQVDADALAADLGVPDVALLNDLEATAYGIGELEAGDVEGIADGDPEAHGNAALLAPGTGLGEAGLYWDGARHRPFATEGGHCDFAPADATDYALHAHLAARFGHVSWERVLSGPGLVNIHEFLREHRGSPLPGWLAEAMDSGDPAPAIAQAAEAQSCPVCVEAMDRFVRYCASEAANLALKFMATGGVYLGGGIPPRIAGRFQEADFLAAFRDKGRMGQLLERIPVRLIRNDRAALLGAARYAALHT